MNQKNNTNDFKKISDYYNNLAIEGTKESVKKIMENINLEMGMIESKIIDYALGLINNAEGINTLEKYLFEGTQIQRNYCTLYFNRKEEFKLVRLAYDQGLIDERQAFSR